MKNVSIRLKLVIAFSFIFVFVAEKAEEVMADYKHDVEAFIYDIEEQRAEDMALINAVIKNWAEYQRQAALMYDGMNNGDRAKANALAEISRHSSKQTAHTVSVMRAMTDETAGISAAAANLEEESKEITLDVLSIADASEEQRATGSAISKNAESLTEMAVEMMKSTQRFMLE